MNSEPTPHLETALLLAQVRSSIDGQIGAALSRVGLSLDDLRRFRAIDGHPEGISREALAEAMGETRSQTVRASLPLIKLGWLLRSETAAFILTDSGRAVAEQAEGIAEKSAARWFDSVGLDPAAITRALTAER